MSDCPHAQRRARVLEAIAPGVLVLPSAPTAVRNNDVEHDYRQDSDFYYLTGFDEPESVLVLSSEGEQPFTLFCRPRDPARETWDGPRLGVERAGTELGTDQAFPIAELETRLHKLIETERLYFGFGQDRAFDERVLGAIKQVRARAKQGVTWPTQLIDPGTVIHELRLTKEAGELSAMEQALEITKDAHVAAMGATRPGMFEYEVEALINSVFRKNGCERPAYGSIVGSGPNATILHYRRNDRRMEDGDLLLIDAGCEYGYYASDVTRTFPVNGRFSKPQREIYDLVLEAQLAGIAATRPGATLDAVHQRSVEVITRGLVRLGILEGPVEKAVADETFKEYFMHKTSHYLGMDVHDVGPYFSAGKPRPLSEGTVITVEPGLYISGDAAVPEQYRGIGVRIEDDVLVTADGSQVLGSAIPKTAEEVEQACA